MSQQKYRRGSGAKSRPDHEPVSIYMAADPHLNGAHLLTQAYWKMSRDGFNEEKAMKRGITKRKLHFIHFEV